MILISRFFVITESRHWVIARAAPWITSQNTPDGQIKTFYGAVFNQCLTGIFRTGGSEPARRRCIGGNGFLVYPDGHQQNGHEDPRNAPDDFSQHNFSFSATRSKSNFTLCSTAVESYSLSSSHIKANAMAFWLSSFLAMASQRIYLWRR